MSAITTFARQLAEADKTFTSAVAVVAKGIAEAFGTDPTFDEWEAGAAEFKTAYATARGCQDSTAVNRWSFVCKELKDQYGMDKPRKPTEAAAKKAEQRGEKAAKVDAIVAQHRTMEDLTRAASRADKTEAKVYAEALLKKAGEVEKQAKADAKERTKALKAELAELTKGFTLAQLEAIVKHARKYAPKVEDASDADEASEATEETGQAQEAAQTALGAAFERAATTLCAALV
jgi:hypothetical protein